MCKYMTSQDLFKMQMMKRLVREITALQQNKSRLQLRVERYNLWWKNLNDWSIIISEPYFNSNQGIEKKF